MKMNQKQLPFVKGYVVCCVFNSMNYEATMIRNHDSSYKVYIQNYVKLMNGGIQMEKANIQNTCITNIRKIHDDHTDKDIFADEQPEQPEQPKTQPKPKNQPKDEPVNNIIDGAPEQPKE